VSARTSLSYHADKTEILMEEERRLREAMEQHERARQAPRYTSTHAGCCQFKP